MRSRLRSAVVFALFSASAFAQTAQFPSAVAADKDLTVQTDKAQSTITGAMTASATSFTVVTGARFRAGQIVSIENEQLLICSVATNTISVGYSACPNLDGRGYAGTIAASHANGLSVSGNVVAWNHNSLKEEVKAIETLLGANGHTLVPDPLPVNKGGTNAQSAAAARASLSAAVKGANDDITSLTGLTTPLPVNEGGTAATTAAGARASLSAAQSGVNADITSLTNLTTPLPVNEGGTNATSAAAARASLSAAQSGVNADITSLTNLTTPLPLSEGGTGQTSAAAALAAILAGSKQGNSAVVQMAGTNSGTLGAAHCNDANGNTTTTGCPAVTLPVATAQLQRLRIKPNTGNVNTAEFAAQVDRSAADFNFTAITPTGSPNISVGSNAVFIAIAPLGLDAPKAQALYAGSGGVNAIYLYISGGTGTAEAVPITGGTCTPGATVCTVSFVAANTHSGAYTIRSASDGVQEAVSDALIAGGGTVLLPAGTFRVYAPITFFTVTVPSYYNAAVTLRGVGKFSTNLQAQSASGGIIDEVNGGRNVFESFGMTSTATHQTAGGYGIRLGSSASQSYFDKLDNLYCEPLYDCILVVNAQQYSITNSIFYNFSHTAVSISAPAPGSDANGPWIRGNVMFNYSLASPAFACVYMTSTGVVSFIDNKCVGNNIGQIQYGFYNHQTDSTGLLITGNEFETLDAVGVLLEGTYNLVTITGNFFAQPGSVGPGYWGIGVVDGTGTGTWQGTISGNVFQGPGSTTSSYGVVIRGGSYNWMIGTNSFNLLQYGIYTDGTGDITVGVQNMLNIETPLTGASGGHTRWNFSAPVTYSGLGGLPAFAANGSALYCTNCNTRCDGGGSTGKTCFRENDAWVAGSGASTIGEVTTYNFTPIVPTGSPTLAAGSRTLTLASAPAGFDATITQNYVYISGGASPFTASITGATNASPVVYTIASTASLATGNFVVVSGITGNVGANTRGFITVLSGTTFSIAGSVGSAAYTAGGTVSRGPEPVPVTGGTCTPGLVNCTIIVTVANPHSGSYTVSSASAGFLECAVANPSKTCHAAAGTYLIYAPVHLFTVAKFLGDGSMNTILQAQGDVGIFDLDYSGVVFEDLQFTAASQQRTAGYAVRMGQQFPVYFTNFSRISCRKMYNCLMAGHNTGAASGSSEWTVQDSEFENFWNDAIIADGTQDAINTYSDNVGPRINNSIFFNFDIPGHAADACLRINATGVIVFTNNFCAGNSDGVDYLIYGVYLAHTGSTGLSIQGNNFQAITTAAINLGAAWDSITIANNTIDQPGYMTGGYGILIASAVLQGTITGNQIQGPAGVNTYRGIDLEGTSGNWTISGNSFLGMDTAYYINTSGSVTLGAANQSGVTTLISKPGSGILFNYGQQPETLFAFANGSNDNVARAGSLNIQASVGTTSAVYSITGFSAGNDGDILTVALTDATHACTIKHNTTSSAGNKIISTTGGDVVLSAAQHVLMFRYGTFSGLGPFWILISVI